MGRLAALFGGIEAGGTTFVCAVGSGPDDLRAEAEFPTVAPDETLDEVAAFFDTRTQGAEIEAVGIASFGPLDLDPHSQTFGHIADTPKPGWAGVDIFGRLTSALDVPGAIDTDVNAALLAERTWGSCRGVQDAIYVTVGTGIGGGAMSNGVLVHGLGHPEMGHITVPHDRSADPFDGCCPYHGDCLEGLASGPAISQRWGVMPQDLPAQHPGWDLEAQYLAVAVANYIFTLAPRRVVLGGGVMEQPRLIGMVKQRVRALLGDYVRVGQPSNALDEYIVPPDLGRRVGVLGAIALARTAGAPRRG